MFFFFLQLSLKQCSILAMRKVCMMGGGYRVRVGGEWGWEGSGRCGYLGTCDELLTADFRDLSAVKM